MFEVAAAAGVTADIEHAQNQLRAIARRLDLAIESAPRRDAGDWAGPAAGAYHASLYQLARELAAAQALLRSATDLLGIATFELAGHA